MSRVQELQYVGVQGHFSLVLMGVQRHFRSLPPKRRQMQVRKGTEMAGDAIPVTAKGKGRVWRLSCSRTRMQQALRTETVGFASVATPRRPVVVTLSTFRKTPSFWGQLRSGSVRAWLPAGRRNVLRDHGARKRLPDRLDV